MTTTTTIVDPRRLDDVTLLRVTRALVVRDNETEADLLEVLAEIDERRLYLPDHTSMFAFCTAELGFSEAVAENLITVARAARRFPRVIALRRSGSIHLSGLRLLAPHLTEENADRLLEQATRKSKRAIEELVACHAPKPAVPESIRKVPERRVAEPVVEEPAPLFAAPRGRAGGRRARAAVRRAAASGHDRASAKAGRRAFVCLAHNALKLLRVLVKSLHPEPADLREARSAAADAVVGARLTASA